jgi:3-phenylpropionate/cinnamic acid dioxygenase small subunit
MSADDTLALNRLAFRYAAAVDACDTDAFLDVFAADARLRTWQPEATEPFVDLAGHEQLAFVPKVMRDLYRRTAHLMTNHLVEIDGDRASGTVLCTARHLHKDPDDREVLVVVIRYVDRYAREADDWRIADREIRFLWSERHEMVEAEFMTEAAKG